MTRYKSGRAETATFPGTNIKADEEAIGLLRMLWTICRSEELVRKWRLDDHNAAELAALSPDEWKTREWELIERFSDAADIEWSFQFQDEPVENFNFKKPSMAEALTKLVEWSRDPVDKGPLQLVDQPSTTPSSGSSRAPTPSRKTLPGTDIPMLSPDDPLFQRGWTIGRGPRALPLTPPVQPTPVPRKPEPSEGGAP